jgi:hypothetical protein
VLGSPITLTPDQTLEFPRIIDAERARNRLMGYEAHGALREFRALGFGVAGALRDGRDRLFYGACVADGLA